MNEGRYPVYRGFSRFLRDERGLRFVPTEAPYFAQPSAGCLHCRYFRRPFQEQYS